MRQRRRSSGVRGSLPRRWSTPASLAVASSSFSRLGGLSATSPLPVRRRRRRRRHPFDFAVKDAFGRCRNTFGGGAMMETAKAISSKPRQICPRSSIAPRSTTRKTISRWFWSARALGVAATALHLIRLTSVCTNK